MAALQPYRDEQLNYFKFASIVLNEFPKALRQTFRSMWDNLPGFQPWDDSAAVRNLFLTTEGGKTKVPTHLPYDEWDCTALFKATIYAKSFALRDSKGDRKILSDLYVEPLNLPYNSFHASVMSPGGNNAETFTLAIDQLRRLRNSLCHSSSSEIDKRTFDQYVQHTKDAFKALGVDTDLIDVIGSLTESHFPTKEVRKLEERIKEETRAYLKFLEEGTANKEDIARLELKIDNLKLALPQDNTGTKPSLPQTCLPPMVPHFTGRQGECDEVTGHVSSESTRIVSIWGSPGFGKTSVATAVGHRLHSEGLPVCFLSLRGVQSKADLTSKLLSIFRRPATSGQPSQSISFYDELLQLFSEISDPFVLILDNADELLESGEPEVKKNFITIIEDILTRSEKVTIVITTRESNEFMNVVFQGHQAVRIRPLDESSSQNLVKKLLPRATPNDNIRITQICGHVPLAVKLLCSSISEDDSAVQPSQALDDFMGSSENSNIVDMLDDPDYPSNLRLKLLFDSSFQRLSVEQKEALVSLSVLPESFDLPVAAAVLGLSQLPMAKKVLQGLRRKSFLDLSAKPGLFTIHKLLESFARERGEHEMTETVLNSKSRLCAFYVSRFEKLNEQFLTGNSMEAFIDFYEEEQCIVQSLIEGCEDPKKANSVFEVLVKAELFLYSLYWRERANFDNIYHTATKIAKKLEQSKFYRQLLVSGAFYEITWPAVAGGSTMQLLSEARDVETPSLPISLSDKGKHFCYSGICQLVTGKTDDGVQCLEEALSLVNNVPEHRILRIVTLQILAIYYRHQGNQSRMSKLFSEALKECRKTGDEELLVISTVESNGNDTDVKERAQQPLKLEIVCLVGEATKHLSDTDSQRSIANAVQQIAKDIESPLFQSSLGLFNFQRNVNITLEQVVGNAEEAAKMSQARIQILETALNKCKSSKQNCPSCKDNVVASNALHQEALAKSYSDHAHIQYQMQNYSDALQAEQRALDIKRKLFGEKHSSTADSYRQLGVTQHELGEFVSSIQSKLRALDIRRKLFGEEHSSTADSYHLLGVTQHALGDFASAIQSAQRALDIRRKLFGEEHSSTADSYHLLGVTQHSLGDLTSATHSAQRALDIRRKLFGEEHSSTADSYHLLGVTQHSLGDLTSVINSAQRALDIRRKLFGEEHSSTADSYHLLGVTQHSLGDLTSAIQSKQRALDIRRKLFGEEHSSTAESFYLLGVTQHSLGDLTSAFQSGQGALDIRRKLFGEEHSSTADSYHLLGVTQHSLGDVTTAIQSKQRALDIRRKLFGEEHSSTADSYHSLGVTQHEQGDLTSAIQSKQRALDIRRKRFGEEHSTTADSYRSLGVTQHEQGDFASAIHSKQRALDIRRKLSGEDHSSTADSYDSLSVTQYALGNVSTALQSAQRALEIRRKLFGEQHSSTADSYHLLGVTQHALGDSTSAIQSAQHALDIRRILFGEEHSSTADSYHLLGVTQHSLGDLTSAIQSAQRALDISRILFGEEHSSTADSYHLLGVTQHSLGDLTSAIQSAQRALDIRRILFGEEHSSTAHNRGHTT